MKKLSILLIIAIIMILIFVASCGETTDSSSSFSSVDSSYSSDSSDSSSGVEENKNITVAQAAWQQIGDHEALKELIGYECGWFYDVKDGTYKYHIENKVTVTTTDGVEFLENEYDGSTPNRYTVSEDGTGDLVEFPD